MNHKQTIYEMTQETYIQENWYYEIYTNFLSEIKSYRCLRRNEAFNYYRDNKGFRIDIVNKWDSKKRETIINRPNIDIERIRDNFTIKKTSKSLRTAISKYDKANTKQIHLKFNKNTDTTILNYLDQVENKQRLIKDLLLEHINKINNYGKDKYILIDENIEKQRLNA